MIDPTLPMNPQDRPVPPPLAPTEPGVIPVAHGNAPASDDPQELQRHLPQYRVRELIGRGGMGNVMKVDDPRLTRTVALKTMKLGPDAGEEDRGRFVREATVLARLAHPNIVPIYDLGADDQGCPFYTMKLVKGRTLQAILKDIRHGAPDAVKQYSLGRLLLVFRKVCDALAFAHSHSVLHRDLKPDNIMVGEFGEVLVMDWGLAKFLNGEEEAWSGAAMSRSLVARSRDSLGPSTLGATLAGSLMGTPQFMSPEQAEGRAAELDERSDIFSLGAILYAILTLHPPVEGKTVEDVLKKISSGQIAAPSAFGVKSESNRTPSAKGEVLDARVFRPLPHCPGGRVPAALSAVTMKALSVDRARRYQSVNDLSAEVEAWQSGFATRAENAGLGRQLVLLVKRHRGVCATAVGAWFIITALALWFVINVTRAKNQAESERGRAEVERSRATANESKAVASEKRAVNNQQHAETERSRAEAALADLRGTAPTFVAQAQALTDNQRFADALEEMDVAVKLAPNDASYHYLRGNLLQSLGRLADAQAAYDEALRLDSGHVFARQSRDVCADLLRTDPGPTLSQGSLSRLNALMRQQGRTGESIATARLLNEDRAALEKTWRAAFAKAGIEGNETLMRFGDDGLFQVSLGGRKSVTNLSFLHGMPISVLNLDGTLVSDLSPLSGSPLRVLDLSNTPVSNLGPLRGLKLKELKLSGANVSDLGPLQGMPLEKLIDSRGNISNITPLKGMPLKYLDLGGAKVTDITVLHGMPLRILHLPANPIHDWTAIRDLPLEDLSADVSFSDLTILKGMPLKVLSIAQSQISDITPLHGLPLENLNISSTRVRDLRPLAGMKLRSLSLAELSIEDLSPLRDMPIGSAQFAGMGITDFSVIANWPLRWLTLVDTRFERLDLIAGKPIVDLDLTRTPVADISPLRGMPIRFLSLWGTRVTDLHPVTDLPRLDRLTIPAGATDIEFLRQLPYLHFLDNRYFLAPRTVAEFWKDYPADKEAREKMSPLMDKLRQSLTVAGVKNLRDDAFTISLGWKIYAHLSGSSISDLGLLRGYPVDEIHLSGTKVTSLEPLRDLPVVTLHFQSTGVTDVRPLLEIPTLQNVLLSRSVKNVEVLREAKNIKRLSYDAISQNGRDWPSLTTEEFWKAYDEQKAKLVPALEALHKMGLKEVTWQQASVNKEGLLELDLRGLQISDISPLAGLSIARLNLKDTKVEDVSPLHGMPLVDLWVNRALVKDISPLRGMRLKHLDLSACPVGDLSPLQGMPLVELHIGLRDGLRPQDGGLTHVTDLTALRGLPLDTLVLDGTIYPDLTPLAECLNLQRLVLPLKVRNVEALRKLPGLQQISFGWPGSLEKVTDAETFWKDYDPKKAGGGE